MLNTIKILFLCLLGQCLQAQSEPNIRFSNCQLEYALHAGTVVPHRTFFRPEISGATFIHEFSYIKQNDNSSKWAGLYGYPLTGISLAYIDLSNKDVLGQAVGVLPFINFRKRKKHFNYNIKIGVGFAYFTKVFDEQTNYTNNAVGGHFTNFTRFAFGINKAISKTLDFNIDFSLSHFSNGNTEQPNLGINIIAGKIGLAYKFNSNTIDFEKTTLPYSKKLTYNLIFGLGFNSVVVNSGPNYPVWVGSFFVAKKHSKKGEFTLGMDYEYHEAVKRFLVNMEVDVNNKLNLNAAKMSLLAGYNFLFPHFNYHVQIGSYVYNPQVKKGDVVVKLNAFYHFKNQYETQAVNPFIGLGLKSHYFSADFVQLILGFGF